MKWKDFSKLDKVVSLVFIFGTGFGFLISPAALYIKNTFGWLVLALIGVVFLSGATICVNKKLGNVAAVILLFIAAFLIGMATDTERPSTSDFSNFFYEWNGWIEN